ncbi:hypothetical protein glysoja_012920 [Glycine soja]|nr:hypothetical protein glysoja_012920 [Glycine soja]
MCEHTLQLIRVHSDMHLNSQWLRKFSIKKPQLNSGEPFPKLLNRTKHFPPRPNSTNPHILKIL